MKSTISTFVGRLVLTVIMTAMLVFGGLLVLTNGPNNVADASHPHDVYGYGDKPRSNGTHKHAYRR